MNRLVLIIIVLIPLAAGCRQPIGSAYNNRPRLVNFGNTGQNGGVFARSANSSNSFFNRNRNQSTQIQTQTPEEYQQYSELAQQINSLNQQVGSTDSDNQQLYAEIAGLKQKLQVANDYNNQIRQQLADNSVQFQQLQTERQSYEQQLIAAQSRAQANQQFAQAQQAQIPQNPIQTSDRFASNNIAAPTQLIGGATVRANNSLLQKLSAI